MVPYWVRVEVVVCPHLGLESGAETDFRPYRRNSWADLIWLVRAGAKVKIRVRVSGTSHCLTATIAYAYDTYAEAQTVEEPHAGTRDPQDSVRVRARARVRVMARVRVRARVTARDQIVGLITLTECTQEGEG